MFPLAGRIPLFVKDSVRYSQVLAQQYAQFIQQSQVYAERLSGAARRNVARRELLEKSEAAFHHNARFVEELLEEVAPLTVLPAGKATETSIDALSYATNFNYARRDWSGDRVAEAELARLHAALRELLAGKLDARTQALFLGAGPGRTAWELSTLFEQTVAIDLSYTMAAFFDRARHAGLTLYEINRSNVRGRADLIREWTAKGPLAGDVARAFNYWIADAAALPLRDRAMDLVFSIYFTDLIPFERLFREVDRVLRPGGLFVHAGPLDYHFDDYADCLTVEEVRERVIGTRYEIVHDDFVETTHLGAEGLISRQVCDNWLFAARKRK